MGNPRSGTPRAPRAARGALEQTPTNTGSPEPAETQLRPGQEGWGERLPPGWGCLWGDPRPPCCGSRPPAAPSPSPSAEKTFLFVRWEVCSHPLPQGPPGSPLLGVGGHLAWGHIWIFLLTSDEEGQSGVFLHSPPVTPKRTSLPAMGSK